MATLSGQKAVLKMNIKSLEKNFELMKKEQIKDAKKVLVSGASAWATSASKHTPPSLGKPKINPIYYVNGVLIRTAQEEKEPPQGRRRVYDLAALVRDEQVKFRSFYGRLLRQGYKYLVKIARPGKKIVQKFCQDLGEAENYAVESYRGLYRAAWGMQFANVDGKGIRAIDKYIQERPAIYFRKRLNKIKINAKKHEITIINEAIPDGTSFMATTEVNARIAAVKTMNDRINTFFKKKYKL